MKQKNNIIFLLILIVITIVFLAFISIKNKNIAELKEENTKLQEKIKKNENNLKNSEERMKALKTKIKKLGYNINESPVIEIDYSKLKEKLNNKDTFILVLTQPSCSHCINYKPVIENILNENNLIAFEIVTSQLTTDERNELKSIINFQGTPTTVFINNGIENKENRIIGNVSKSKLESKLDDLGYI